MNIPGSTLVEGVEPVGRAAEQESYDLWRLPSDVSTALLMRGFIELVAAPSGVDLPMIVTNDVMREHVEHVEAADRRRLVAPFASRAYDVEGVREVRLTELSPELLVTVLTDERDMQRDMKLQRIFSDTVRNADRRLEAALRVRVYGYDEPDEDGELLAP